MTTRPIRTYAISVDGREPGLYCARSTSKARYSAWIDFHEAWQDATFLEFLRRAKVSVVPNSCGSGDRIVVLGRAATRVHYQGIGQTYARPPQPYQNVRFVYDGEDQIRVAHRSDVSEAAPC